MTKPLRFLIALAVVATLGCSEATDVGVGPNREPAEARSTRGPGASDAPSFIRRPVVETSHEAALPAFNPEHEEALSGSAKVLDTGNLLVGLDVAPLHGVSGVGGEPMEALQAWIDAHGKTVTCSPHGRSHFVCRSDDGVDIAAKAIELGAARAAQEAPEAYREREETARRQETGIWGGG